MDRYESLIDEQIRLAAERGEFDDLPGTGKPLKNLGEARDELWWLRGYMEREGLSGEALLPPALQLRRQAERLTEEAATLPSEQAVRDAVRGLNRRIADYLRSPSGPHVPVGVLDAGHLVDRWHAAHRSTPPAPTPPPAAPQRRRWWRRR